MTGSTVRNYFDTHGHSHSYNRSPESYTALTEYLQDHHGLGHVLDVGCGNGSFLKAIAGGAQSVTGTELSTGMLDIARENLKTIDVRLEVVGDDIDYLLFFDFKRFDIIHIDSVLHHVVSRTRTGSFRKAAMLLSNVGRVLRKHGGVLVVEEMYYESAGIKSLTAWLIFYGLKFLNAFHIDAGKYIPNVQMGLEVNFYNETQLVSLLEGLGYEVKVIQRRPAEVLPLYKRFFLRKLGKVTLVATKP